MFHHLFSILIFEYALSHHVLRSIPWHWGCLVSLCCCTFWGRTAWSSFLLTNLVILKLNVICHLFVIIGSLLSFPAPETLVFVILCSIRSFIVNQFLKRNCKLTCRWRIKNFVYLHIISSSFFNIVIELDIVQRILLSEPTFKVSLFLLSFRPSLSYCLLSYRLLDARLFTFFNTEVSSSRRLPVLNQFVVQIDLLLLDKEVLRHMLVSNENTETLSLGLWGVHTLDDLREFLLESFYLWFDHLVLLSRP